MSNPWEKYDKGSEGGSPWQKYSAPTESRIDESVQQPTPQLTSTESSVDVPQTRDLVPMLKGAGQTFMREAGDVAQGLVEGPGAVISGAASFIPAVLSQAPTVLGGVLAGKPMAGLAAAKEGMDEFMESFSFKPKSRFGQTVAEVAASPFTVAHEGIETGVKTLGGSDEQVKAGQFMFDSALVGLPHIAKKIKKGEKLTQKEIEEVKVVTPEVKPDILTDVLSQVGKIKPEVKKGEVPVAKFPENQFILDGLQKEVDKRSGPRRASYQKALDIVRDHGEDIGTLDMGKISKAEGKVRKLVQKLREERDAQAPILQDVNQVNKPSEILPVEEVQEGLKPVEQIKTPEEIGKEISPQMEYLGPNKIGEITVHEWRDGETKGNFQTLTTDPLEVKTKFDKITSALKEPVLSKEEVAAKYAKTSAPEMLEPKGLPTVEAPVLPLNFVKEQDLRQIRSDLKQKLEERKAAEKLAEETKVPEVPEVKQRTAQDLQQIYSQWKTKKVEKLNEDAALNNLTQQTKTPMKESDLAVVDDKFATFKTYDELVEYAAETGTLGRPTQDPLTKRWYIEPKFKELEDYAWDALEEVGEGGKRDRSTERLTDEDFPYWELSDTGTRNLWDVFNNERGSVNVTDLKIAADKLKRIEEKAKSLGKSVEEMLDMIGIEPETAKKIMEQMVRLPQMQDEVRKADPILYEIFHPEKDKVISQKIKHYKKKGTQGAETSTFPAITSDAFKTVWGQKKELIPTNWGKKYLAANEIRMRTAQRLGVKELLYDKWEVKKADASRELKSQKKLIQELTKDLSSQERSDLSIVAHAREEGGIEVLAADGITHIPTLTSKLESKLQRMRELQDSLYDRHNYNRVRTGQRSIPYRENYYTWIRKENALKEAGIDRNLNTVKLTQMQAHSSKFNGTNFPFAKPRSLKAIPIELDIFDNYLKYVERGLSELHTAPIAALAKELADLKVGKKNSSVGLAQHNPAMYKFLVEWSDEINGVDRISEMINGKFPGVMKVYNGLMHNIVVATLFGNAGTFMKQPLALRGIWADTTTYDTLAGILKTTKERSLREVGISSKSNVLEIRKMDIALDELAKNVTSKGLKSKRDAAAMIAAWPMQILDGLTAEAGWNAGYSFAKRKLKYDDAKAFRYAEDLITRTQGIGVKGAVAPIQATAAFKFMTMFQTFQINDFNYLAHDILKIKNPDIGNFYQVRRVAKYFFAGALVNTLAQMAGLPTPFPSPFETFNEERSDGSAIGDATIAASREFAEVLPELGGSLKYQSNLAGPMAEFLAALPDAMGGVNYTLGWTLESLGVQAQSLDWYNMTDKEKLKVKLETGKVIGTMLGIPMTNQIVKSIRASSNGGDWFEVLYGVYVKAGKTAPPRPPQLDGRLEGGLSTEGF